MWQRLNDHREMPPKLYKTSGMAYNLRRIRNASAREKPMKSIARLTLWLSLFIAVPASAAAQSPEGSGAAELKQIIARVEARYEITGFTADFHQVSTVKAMAISDEAFGRIYVRKPGMMRWEYEKPEPQVIITNGNRLWIYRPQDNQVMVGRAPAFFAGGKGAGFLADIKVLRRKFNVSLVASDQPGFDLLKLVPIEKTIDVSEIFLYVSKENDKIYRVATVNPYGDQTTIDFTNARFDQVPDAALFSFTVPEGTDVIEMDE
jgi:outer membrane lipoprotein carrier protein